MPYRLSEIRFTPTIVPTVAAFCAVPLMLYLGHWQQERAEEKRALQIEFDKRSAAPPVALGVEIRDPVALRFARAIARGEWQESGQIFLDNKFDNESVGFHVITPLKLEGTNRYALVNRGWIARSASYPQPPSISAPQGLVTVEGVLSLPSTRFLELSQTTVQGNVWQNFTVERYHKSSGWDVLPLAGTSKLHSTNRVRGDGESRASSCRLVRRVPG